MSNPIIQLTANDFEQAMDFLNLVFSVHGPHDFARLLPKIYRPTDEHMQHNYAIKENGRIRAIVGMFPMTLVMNGIPLKLAGIGGVSSHPNDRGKGHMKRLMLYCVEKMKAEGYQLSWLDGQRQRYGYFGYETCGQRFSANFEKGNIKHTLPETEPLQFIKVEKENKTWLDQLQKQHEQQPLHVLRAAADFYHFGTSWKSSLYAAVDSKNRVLGYIIVDPKKQLISEFVAASKSASQRMLQTWLSASENEPWWITIPPVNNDVFASITSICEFPQITPSGCWQIFDWPAVLTAAMSLRQRYSPLMQGNVTIKILGVGTCELSVSQRETSCRFVKAEADLSVDTKTAMRLFFGPLPASSVVNLQGAAQVLDAWCPLPLYLSHPDWV